jgi:hypothetical protein
MNWEQGAVLVCKELKGLEVVGFEGGWVFVKDNKNKIYPVRESIVAEWIKEYYN